MNALGNRDFLVGRESHTFFVDRESDYGRAVALRHWQHFAGAFLTVFEIDRIDDGFARDAFERNFDHIGLGRIDENRRGHTRGNLFENRTHVALLVFAHDRAAQIEHV